MTDKITIPPEALEAAENLGFVAADIEDIVRAALSAWPGMLTERRARCDAVVLPYNLDADLPQEASDE